MAQNSRFSFREKREATKSHWDILANTFQAQVRFAFSGFETEHLPETRISKEKEKKNDYRSDSGKETHTHKEIESRDESRDEEISAETDKGSKK